MRGGDGRGQQRPDGGHEVADQFVPGQLRQGASAGDVADERDADDQRGEQVGVYLGARAEHPAEGRGYLALGRRVERHRGILAGRGAADQGEDERRLATARGLGLRHKRRRDALRERVQVTGRDLGGDARPGQRLEEQLLLGAEVAHHQAVRDAGPPGDLPDGRARVAALVEDLARCLEDRRPRRFRVAPALGRRAVWPGFHGLSVQVVISAPKWYRA